MKLPFEIVARGADGKPVAVLNHYMAGRWSVLPYGAGRKALARTAAAAKAAAEGFPDAVLPLTYSEPRPYGRSLDR